MTARTFSKLLIATREAAERDQFAAARDVYERAITATAHEARTAFSAITAAAWQPPPDGAILTPLALKKLAARLNRDLESVWTTVVLEVPGAALAHAGISWDVAHPLAQGLLDAAAQRTGAALGAAIQPVLRKAIGDAYTDGLSVRETAANIQTAIADAAPWQAEMLARTDLNSLANGASHAAARLVGVGFKTWDATLDDRTRLTHADAHGQTVPIDAPFDVGGEALDYPGDPNGSDGEVLNCRCTLVYADTLVQGEALLADAGGTIMDVKTKNRRGLAAAATTLQRTIPFHGVAGVEGKVSDDNTIVPRVLLPDSLAWTEMPVSFMAQIATAEGHDGAEVAGRVDEFSRKRGAGRMRSIRTTGELTTPFGLEQIAPMIADKTMRYVSIDLGASQWSLVDRESFALIPDEEFDLSQANAGAYALGLTSGKIKALTLVATQAIEGAMVALTASADARGIGIEDLGDGHVRVVVPLDEFALRSDALVASAAPAKPPRAWFETQEPPGKMPLTITDEGRVFGHLADWESCHLSFLPSCVPPPKSASNYAYFHAGEVETAEGDRIAVGKLMVGGRHDNNLSHSREEAMRHYDDLSRVGAVLRAHDGKYGIWVSGALHHSVSEAQVADMKLNPPSGDWRIVNGQHELICGLSVPVPGFPIPRVEMQIVASGGELQMGALVAALGPDEPDHAAIAGLVASGALTNDEALELDHQDADRRLAVLAARAEGVDALLALAEA